MYIFYDTYKGKNREGKGYNKILYMSICRSSLITTPENIMNESGAHTIGKHHSASDAV